MTFDSRPAFEFDLSRFHHPELGCLGDYFVNPTIQVTYRHEGLWLSEPLTASNGVNEGRYYVTTEMLDGSDFFSGGGKVAFEFIDGIDVLQTEE